MVCQKKNKNFDKHLLLNLHLMNRHKNIILLIVQNILINESLLHIHLTLATKIMRIKLLLGVKLIIFYK